MIDAQMFVNSLNGKLNRGRDKSRSYIRGFLDIEYDLITAGQLNRPFTTVCELGIGGGGKHNLWKRCGATTVIGVDIIDPKNKERWDRKDSNNYPYAINFLSSGIEYYWNSSSYSFDTPKKINKIFDVILDDSDTGEIWGKKNKHDVINVWKDYLATDGLFISETVNGQDEDASQPRSLEYHMPAFEHLAEQGMVIFDTRKLGTELDQKVIGDGKTTHHLGVYTKQWDIYKPVIEKYKDYIVCGEVRK